MSRERASTGWFLAAAVPGFVHAGASLYWAAGGSLLLETVGSWAVRLQQDSPALAGSLLLGIGLIKLVAVAVPVANQLGRLPRPRLWRVLCWVGALVLVLYGGANMITAWFALGGWFGPVADLSALRGHAFLWDPLFAIWGVLLVIALARSRSPAGTRP